MANPQKVSFAQMRVGIMALAAMAIVGVLIFLLTRTAELFHAHVPFAYIHGRFFRYGQGAAVRLNGIPVGDGRGVEVDRIRRTPSG